MKRKISAIRLQQMNKAYWNTFAKEPPKYKLAQIIRSRKRYFSLLRRKIPFLKKILDPKKQKVINIKIDGKYHPFNLLGTGFEMVENYRPVVIVLDHVGKKYLFYRSTGIYSKKPGEWIPFISFKPKREKDGTPYIWYEKFEEHPNFPEVLVKLGKEIKKLEPEIDFLEESSHSFVNAINSYL